MEPEQLRQLMDSFDSNGDGTVSKIEFLEFITPESAGGDTRPVVRGDTSAVLERMCIFETTCHDSGMPNAFVVTASKKKPKTGSEGEITQLGNGEYRLKTMLPELKRAKQILLEFGFDVDGDDKISKPIGCEIATWDKLDLYADDSGKGKKKKKIIGNDDDDDDYYGSEDDYNSEEEEEGGGDDDGDDTTKTSLRVRKQKKGERAERVGGGGLRRTRISYEPLY